MSQIQGLAEREAIARRARGVGNDVQLQATRSCSQILRQNAVTFINATLFSIGIVLILLGRVGDAVVKAGLVLMSVVVVHPGDKIVVDEQVLDSGRTDVIESLLS